MIAVIAFSRDFNGVSVVGIRGSESGKVASKLFRSGDGLVMGD